MSDQDQVKPYHAKGSAPGQEAADVVAEVLAHAAQREEAAQKKTTPKGPPKWMLPLTVNLGVLALYFLIAQPEFLVLNPNDDPRPVEARIQNTTDMMFPVVASIRRYADQNGRLPSTLEEANVAAAAEFDYSTSGDSAFLLIASVGDSTIVYDSQTVDDAEFFAGLAQRMGR